MTELEKTRMELQKLKERKEVLEHQLVRSKNRIETVEKKRSKARTHRLIIEGAELEYIFENIELLTTEKFREFMRNLAKLSQVKGLYKYYMEEYLEKGDE